MCTVQSIFILASNIGWHFETLYTQDKPSFVEFAALAIKEANRARTTSYSNDKDFPESFSIWRLGITDQSEETTSNLHILLMHN